MDKRSLFERWMFEAPGDDPNTDPAPETAPDIPEDPPTAPDDPPDLAVDDTPDEPGDLGDEPVDDGPPDLGEDTFDDLGQDDMMQQGAQNMGLSDKVSSILNLNLYQYYTELLSQIGSNIASIKHNSDLLYSLSDEVEEIVNALKKLDENMRLYIDNNFTNERYEKNLLFYNKCKNLNKFLNDKFDSVIHKGIKEQH